MSTIMTRPYTRRKDPFRIVKVAQSFRFTPKLIKQIERAAKQFGVSKTHFIELAIKEHLDRNGS
jgi:hypothetical protein